MLSAFETFPPEFRAKRGVINAPSARAGASTVVFESPEPPAMASTRECRRVPSNPSSSLSEGGVYVQITNGYHDAADNRGQAANATVTVDTAGPAQPTFDQANNATVTNARRNITLAFGEAMRAACSPP